MSKSERSHREGRPKPALSMSEFAMIPQRSSSLHYKYCSLGRLHQGQQLLKKANFYDHFDCPHTSSMLCLSVFRSTPSLSLMTF